MAGTISLEVQADIRTKPDRGIESFKFIVQNGPVLCMTEHDYRQWKNNWFVGPKCLIPVDYSIKSMFCKIETCHAQTINNVIHT